MSSVDDARPEPRRPAFVEVPKPGGGARRLTVLHSTDSTAYGRAVGRLAAMLERVLGPAVAANRVEPGPIVRLRPWREERRRFEAQAADYAALFAELAVESSVTGPEAACA